MQIRKASLDDAEKIAKNNVMLALESENMEIEYETTLEGIKTLIKNDEKGFYIVAEDGGSIIGQLMVTYEWSDWRGEDIWWLQSIYVNKEWRRKGVMNGLIEEVKIMAEENGIHELRLYVHKDNENAIKAYEKIGMRKLPYYIFSKDLSN